MSARSGFARQGARYDIVIPSGKYPVQAPRSIDVMVRASIASDGLPVSGTMWSMQGPTDAWRLRVDGTGRTETTARGSTVRSVPLLLGYYLAGDGFEWHYWYDGFDFGLQEYSIRINGVNRWPFRIGEGGPDGSPTIKNPYGVVVGSDFGQDPWNGTPFFTQYKSTNHGNDAIPIYEFAIMGDSTTDWSVNWVAVPNLMYTIGQRWTRPGIAQLCSGGSTIAAQKAEWQNASCDTMRGAAGLKCFVYLIGVNNIIAADSAVSILAQLQDLRDTCAADNLSAKHIMCTITPCRAFLSGTTYAIWQAVNTGIRGGTITGLDVMLDIANTALNDGSDNLAAAYDYGDHLHPNNAGRAIIAANFVTGLRGLGLLP